MLQITLTMGLFGALLMFCGDMLLYFTKEPYQMDGTLSPYIGIMRKLSAWRLKLGGALGPMAAFWYCAGYASVYLATAPAVQGWGLAATLLLCFGIIVGGAYHSHFTYLGLLGRTGEREVEQPLIRNITLLSFLSLLPIGVGCLILALLMLFGNTLFPAWLVLLSPGLLYFLKYLWVRLPQPFRVVVLGGWSNLIFVIFFGVALLVV